MLAPLSKPNGSGFGSHLELAMTAAGLSRKELAGKLSVDQSLVGKWLRGSRTPSVENLRGLVRLLVSDAAVMAPHDAVEWVRKARASVSGETVTQWCEGQVRAGIGHWVTTQPYLQLRQAALNRALPADDVLAVVGMAGVGKSAMLQTLGRDPAVQERFDLVLTVAGGEDRRLMELLAELLAQIDPDEQPPADEARLVARLQRALVNRRALVVVDEVWEEEQLGLRALAREDCRILLATRQEDLLGATLNRAARIEAQPMSVSEGVLLLERFLGLDWRPEMAQPAAHAVSLVEGLPLALTLMALQVPADGWGRWLAWLEDEQGCVSYLRAPGLHSAGSSVAEALAQSLRRLDGTHRETLAAICRRAEPPTADELAVELNVNPAEANRRLKLLAWRHLLRLNGGRVQTHRLVCAYLRWWHAAGGGSVLPDRPG